LQRILHLQPFFEILGSKLLGVTKFFLPGRDVIDHVTIRFPVGHFMAFLIGRPLVWKFGTKPLTNSNGFRDDECDATVAIAMTYRLKRPLNKGQDHSIWYQSISHNTTSYRLPIYISLFTTKVVQYMQEYKYKYKKTDNHKEDRQSR